MMTNELHQMAHNEFVVKDVDLFNTRMFFQLFD